MVVLKRPLVLVPLILVTLVVSVVAALPGRASPLSVTGLSAGPVGAAALAAMVVRADGHGQPVRLFVDDRLVASASGVLVARLGALGDGPHRVRVEVPGDLLRSAARRDATVMVLTAPPTLAIDPHPPVGLREAVTVTGRTTARTLTSAAGGQPVVGPDGRFSVRYSAPPVGATLTGTDAAGNTTTAALSVEVRRPTMRGVHMTGLAWTSAALREPILALIKTGQIDTVELDLKDEDGFISFASTNPLALQIGAVKSWYDARKAVDQLHAAGARVVGRLVAFRDPALATWAYANGQRQMVIQAPGGAPYRSSYGPISFTNFADPKVRAYNIDLAAEAAKLGFDDVLYDYCRRPDGPIAGMVFPGLTGSPAASITSFMRDSQTVLRPLGTSVGASVFGIAADRPDEVAQNVPELAKYVDFIAPMVYPSHWAKGEYGVADPNRQPAEIVSRSLAVFQRHLQGTTVALVPWLQDFSLGVAYGPDQVRAQIDAAKGLGITSFLLWNAGARYQPAALVGR